MVLQITQDNEQINSKAIVTVKMKCPVAPFGRNLTYMG
jgi:hypothetical protein